MPFRTGSWLMTFAIAGLLLGGCTRIGVVYNRLDSLLHLQLARYVDLDKSQLTDLDSRFDALWHWHRSTQLPLYAREVRDIQRLTGAPLTPLQIKTIADHARRNAEVTVIEALRAATPILVSLSDAQVASVLDEIDKRAAKEKRKQQKLGNAEWAEQQADEAVDRFDEWVGSVTLEQRQRIQQWSTASKRPPLDEYAPRRRAFAELLRQRHAADFSQRWERYGLQAFSAEVIAKGEQQRQLTQQLLVDLSRSATPAQRAYFQQKLAAMAVELDTLAQGPAS